MDDVAKELCISKKTLYEHFTDKVDLVRKVILNELKESGEKFEKIENQNLNSIEELFEVNRILNEVIKNFNPAIDYDLRKYYPELYKEINENKREFMYNSIKDNMEKGKKEGLYRADLNVKIIAKLHIARIESKIDSDFFSLYEFTSTEVFNEVFIYHLRGICSEKGIRFFEEKLKELKINKNE